MLLYILSFCRTIFLKISIQIKKLEEFMQMEQAKKLRKMNCNKSCNHNDIAKEYYLGTHTGDYVCTQCGHAFASRREWEEMQESVKAKSKNESNI